MRSGNPRTINLPKGYDAGFAPHNFDNLTASRNQSVDAVLMQKLSQSEPRLASRLINDVISQRPQAVAMLNTAMAEMVETVTKEKMARGQMKYVGVLSDEVLTKLDVLDKAPQSAVIAVRDQDVLHALRDNKQAKAFTCLLSFGNSCLKSYAILKRFCSKASRSNRP